MFKRILTVIAALVALVAITAPVAGEEIDWATVTGYAVGSSDNNHEATWGVGCTKAGNPGGSTYLLPGLTGGLVYDLVVVKAGSDVSTDGHANTLFDNPVAGETVWADSNGSGAFDEGDKTISHIIICTAKATPTPTPTATPTPTPTPTPTATPTPTPTPTPLTIIPDTAMNTGALALGIVGVIIATAGGLILLTAAMRTRRSRM